MGQWQAWDEKDAQKAVSMGYTVDHFPNSGGFVRVYIPDPGETGTAPKFPNNKSGSGPTYSGGGKEPSSSGSGGSGRGSGGGSGGGGGGFPSGSAGSDAFGLGGTGMQNGQVVGVTSNGNGGYTAPAGTQATAEQKKQMKAVMERLLAIQKQYEDQMTAAKAEQMGVATSMGTNLVPQAQEAARQQSAKLQSNLTSRGLGNSTVTAAVERGVQRDLDTNLANISDQQSRLRLSIMQQYQPTKPDWNMYSSLLMQPGALDAYDMTPAAPANPYAGTGAGLTSPAAPATLDPNAIAKKNKKAASAWTGGGGFSVPSTSIFNTGTGSPWRRTAIG